MTFTPAIPLGGVAGLRFLERTGDAQRAAHANSPEIQRDIAYFAENIGNVKTAEDLVSDRRLLKVTLGAFGLGDEIDKRAFIREILQDGVETPGTLGSRLNNQNYIDMAKTLRFDRESGPRIVFSAVQEEITSKYLSQSFEIAVGEQDSSLRLALDFKRRIGDVSERGWYALLGDQPMRAVLQTALGIPTEAAAIDIDKQVELFESRALSVLGTRDASELSQSANIDKLVSRYLIIDQSLSGPTAATRGATAVTLLANAASGFGSFSSQSLFQSGF